jgi:hypothetical protein
VKKVITALEALMTRPEARVVFDDTLPAVDPARVDYLLFHLPTLKLPKREQLSTEEAGAGCARTRSGPRA